MDLFWRCLLQRCAPQGVQPARRFRPCPRARARAGDPRGIYSIEPANGRWRECAAAACATGKHWDRLDPEPMNIEPLSPAVRDYLRAFDLIAIAVTRAGR